MSEPLQGTASAALAIQRVKYSHDAMIDLIIANPVLSQGAIAQHFGYTQAWVSRVFNSDAFQARLAVRKADLVDPTILMSVEEKFRTLVNRSLDIFQEKLEATKSADLAMKGIEMATKALGYGARQANVAVQNNFVVAMPQKVEDPAAWATRYQQSHAAGGQVVAEAVEVGFQPAPGAAVLGLDAMIAEARAQAAAAPVQFEA